MIEHYEVGDIIRNTHYDIVMLILKNEKSPINRYHDVCHTLLLTNGTEKHHYVGAIVRWAGWPNNSGPWERLA